MIDLTKICVRSYLETFKEGVIAREALIPVIKRAISSGYLTDAEINEFKAVR